MWFKVVASVLLAFLAQACVADVRDSKYPKPLSPEVVFHGDTTFTADERRNIEESANIWREQTSGLANIRVVWDWSKNTQLPNNDNHIERLDQYDLEVIMEDCEISEANGLKPCTPSVLAWVSPSGGIHNPDHDPVMVKFIPERYQGYDDYFQSVAIHEFGHVLGLPHLAIPQAVMYPSQNAVKTCLKQPDLAMFCQTNVCDKREMKPCE